MWTLRGKISLFIFSWSSNPGDMSKSEEEFTEKNLSLNDVVVDVL